MAKSANSRKTLIPERAESVVARLDGVLWSGATPKATESEVSWGEAPLDALKHCTKGRLGTFWLLFLILVVFFALFDLRNTLVESSVGADFQFEPLDSQRHGYTSTAVSDLWSAIGRNGRVIYVTSQLSLDMLFPLFLLWFSWWAVRQIFDQQAATHGRFYVLMLSLPLLMAASDVTENLLIVTMMLLKNSHSLVAPVASALTQMKWLFVYATGFGLVAAFISQRTLLAGRIAQYVVFIRVPLFFAAILLILTAARTSPTIQNLLTFETKTQVAYAAFGTYLACVIIISSAVHIWRLAQERFGVPKLGLDYEPGADFPDVSEFRRSALRRARWIIGASALLLAAPLILSFKIPGDGSAAIIASIAGLLPAVLIQFFVFWVSQRLNGVGSKSKFAGLSRRTIRLFGDGYIYNGYRLYHGHMMSLSIFLVLGLLYFLGYRALHPEQPMGQFLDVPPIAYVVSLIAFLCLALSKISFLFDRIRVPVLLILLFWVGLLHVLQNGSDETHFFDVEMVRDAGTKPTISEAFAARASFKPSYQARENIIVIAVSGGGIHAAGWATAVLSGLHAELGEEFLDDVYFISSTSGGSVGVYYFIEAARTDSALIEQAPRAATASSLEATSWGAVFTDIPRYIVPFARTALYEDMDRAQAMEVAWLRWRHCMLNEAKSHSGSLERIESCRRLSGAEFTEGTTMLSDWGKDAASGRLPGIVFNATIIEDGQQFYASSLDLSELEISTRDEVGDFALPNPKSRETEDVLWSFGGFDPTLCRHYRLLKDCAGGALDMAAVTAARLSSTFPYVSPVARAKFKDSELTKQLLRDWHVADGGYFDNSGTVAAIRWLEVTRNQLATPSNILFVQINPFPEDELSSPDSGERDSRHMLKSLIAPLEGLYAVRNSSQRTRADFEAWLMNSLFPESGPGSPQFAAVEFRPRGDVPDRPEPPVSWELSDKNIERICLDWKDSAHVVQAIENFLSQTEDAPQRELSCGWLEQ